MAKSRFWYNKLLELAALQLPRPEGDVWDAAVDALVFESFSCLSMDDDVLRPKRLWSDEQLPPQPPPQKSLAMMLENIPFNVGVELRVEAAAAANANWYGRLDRAVECLELHETRRLLKLALRAVDFARFGQERLLNPAQDQAVEMLDATLADLCPDALPPDEDEDLSSEQELPAKAVPDLELRVRTLASEMLKDEWRKLHGDPMDTVGVLEISVDEALERAINAVQKKYGTWEAPPATETLRDIAEQVLSLLIHDDPHGAWDLVEPVAQALAIAARGGEGPLWSEAGVGEAAA
ncbi:MAG: hypothetical protein HN348_19440, partial [Proteobacteria bacterium]|nr:hypothetical protein [Pseudomonadota bacterium]